MTENKAKGGSAAFGGLVRKDFKAKTEKVKPVVTNMNTNKDVPLIPKYDLIRPNRDKAVSWAKTKLSTK